MDTQLARLESTLARHYPALHRELRPPADQDALRRAWAEVGVEDLPDGYVALMCWHDGTSRSLNLVPEYGWFLQHGISIQRREGMRWAGFPDEVHRAIPILEFEGYFVLLDPTSETLLHWDPTHITKAFDSLQSMVEPIAAWYEEGHVVVADDDDVYPTIVNESAFRAVHARLNPRSDPPPWA